jgi:hypothetical protein
MRSDARTAAMRAGNGTDRWSPGNSRRDRGLTLRSVRSPSEERHVVGEDLADAALLALVLKDTVLQPAVDGVRSAHYHTR